jgi:hypothetical protein
MDYRTLDYFADHISGHLPDKCRLKVNYILDVGDDHNLFMYNDGAIIESLNDMLIVKNRVGPPKCIAMADPDCFKLVAEALISAGDQIVSHRDYSDGVD